MDFEEKRKRQMARVIIAEIGMVISVVLVVIVATLAAMGFMISSNGSIEQSGLLQLHTQPTGASVKIDGNAIFTRTNLSRTLSSGEHYLEISRDNYDTWQNTIMMKPGVLLRLYYPRLFLQNRTVEPVQKLTAADNLEFYSISDSRNYILYAEKDASEWYLIDTRSDNLKTTPLDVASILPGMVEEKTRSRTVLTARNYKFQGKIEQIIWAGNEENVLAQVSYDGKTEWVLVRLRDLAQSVNITETFGLSNDAGLKVIDGSATQLYVLENHQLRRINANDGVMSRVLLTNVWDFANYGANVIYLMGNSEQKQRTVGVYRDDEKTGTTLAEIPDGTKVQLALSNYYDDDYMIWTVDQDLRIWYGRLPSYDENGADLSNLQKLVENVQFSEVPEKLLVSSGNEFIVAQRGNKLMAIDLEMGDLREYEAPLANVRWFDASMFYTIKDGQIIVWDFDGANKRNLAESVQVAEDAEPTRAENYSVLVTSGNHWIYYLTKVDNNLTLTRERIRD